MSGEAKVNLALEMSSAVAALVLDSVRDKHPRISRIKLWELARKRFRSRSTSQQHIDDIRAILENTRADTKKRAEQARKDGTLEIFREILQTTQTRKSRNIPQPIRSKTRLKHARNEQFSLGNRNFLREIPSRRG